MDASALESAPKKTEEDISDDSNITYEVQEKTIATIFTEDGSTDRKRNAAVKSETGRGNATILLHGIDTFVSIIMVVIGESICMWRWELKMQTNISTRHCDI